MPLTLNVIQFTKHLLARLPKMYAFHTAYACYKCVRYWQKNKFADSSIAQVKNMKISSCRWWCFLTATFTIGTVYLRQSSNAKRKFWFSILHEMIYCVSMFIFSQFCAWVTCAHKAFTPQHSNKIIRGQIDLSLERVAMHTGTYVRAYGTQRFDSNVKTCKREKINFWM